MPTLRKFELSCGIATPITATALSLLVLNFDWNSSRIVNDHFPVARELSLVTVLFMCPGVMVGIGGYVHAAKRKWWGQVVLAMGCVAVLGSFLFLFAILPYVTLSPWSLLNFSFVLFAILTLVFSFHGGEKKVKHHVSASDFQ